MTVNALNILVYHALWTLRRMVITEEPPSDEKLSAYRETRAGLLEKLTEYAVGTSSSPTPAIKKAVRPCNSFCEGY